MNAKINSAARWAIVTFLIGISCGILGHYMPPMASLIVVPLLSGLFALAGWLVIGDV